MKIKLVLKFIGIFSILFIFYLVLFGIVPYLFTKNVSSSFKNDFDVDNYLGDGYGDRVALVENTDEAFITRIKMVRNTSKTLDVVYHTFQYGDTTRLFLAEIIRAADNGVKVRFLLDGVAGGMLGTELNDIKMVMMNHDNIDFRVYSEVNLLRPWELNAILHDKFIISDDKYLLLGGRNIGDVYFDPPGHEDRVSVDRDVFVYNEFNDFSNSVISEVKLYMNELFSTDVSSIKKVLYSTEEEVKYFDVKRELSLFIFGIEGNFSVLYEKIGLDELYDLTVPTNKVSLINNGVTNSLKEPIIAYVLGNFLMNSEDSVIMQSPYLTANKKMLKLFKGVDIDEFVLVTNSLASSPNMMAYSNYYVNKSKFVKSGVKIYEYQSNNVSLHSKSYLFDDNLSVVGSFNLDDRSINLSTETMLVIDSKEFNAILRCAIKGYQKDSLVVGTNTKYESGNGTSVSFLKTIQVYVMSIISRIFQFLV